MTTAATSTPRVKAARILSPAAAPSRRVAGGYSSGAADRWRGPPCPSGGGAGMTTTVPRTRILILGGGFGGVYTALTLEKLLGSDPGVEIGLVSREDYLVFQPMLPEVISGNIGIVDTISPIRRLCPGTTLYTREIEGID